MPFRGVPVFFIMNRSEDSRFTGLSLPPEALEFTRIRSSVSLRPMNMLSAVLLILFLSSGARADVPTPLEDCEMSRWSLCRLEAGGLTSLQGPCPAGSETLRPYDPTKDCSAAAIAREIKAREQRASEQRVERDREMKSAAALSHQPVGVANTPRTGYVPFTIFIGISIVVVGLSLRRQIRRGGSPIRVILHMAVTLAVAIGVGLIAAYWTLLVVTKRIGNTDGPAAGVLGLLAAVFAFGIFGPIGGYVARRLLNRFAGASKKK